MSSIFDKLSEIFFFMLFLSKKQERLFMSRLRLLLYKFTRSYCTKSPLFKEGGTRSVTGDCGICTLSDWESPAVCGRHPLLTALRAKGGFFGIVYFYRA